MIKGFYEMKKVIIYCFSGTGNTKKVCGMLADELKNYEYETEIFSITYDAYKKKVFPDPNEYDVIGLAYPGHAFNAPELFNKFVKRLPKAKNGQQAFIIKTSGEPFAVNNSASQSARRSLRKKGYNFTYEKHYLMPYNIMFRYPNGLAKQMYLYSEQMAKVSAKAIVDGKKEWLKQTCGSVIMCFLGKIEWFGAWFNGLFYHVNKKLCTKCGLCAKECPAHNITITEKGKFKFGAHCTMCCRCTMNCPQNAVRMGMMDSWRVNKPYPFKQLVEDKELSANYVNEKTTGYFRKFNKYYGKIDAELKEFGITPPRENFEPNAYAIMPKKERKKLNKQNKKEEKRLAKEAKKANKNK